MMPVRVAIMTVSDSALAGTRADASGPALRDRCLEVGWQIVAECLVADELILIATAISTWTDDHVVDLVLTTGGTGIAPRDVTPEATRSVLDREIPGIAEFLRQKGLEQTRYSILSRGVAGSRKQSLIINLPGSPSGAAFSLRAIEHLILHSVNLLRGNTDH